MRRLAPRNVNKGRQKKKPLQSLFFLTKGSRKKPHRKRKLSDSNCTTRAKHHRKKIVAPPPLTPARANEEARI